MSSTQATALSGLGRRPIHLRLAGFAARLAVLILAQAVVLWLVSLVLGGVDVPSFSAAVATVVVLSLLNALLWPLMIRLLLPLTVLTFGLLTLVPSALVVIWAFEIVDDQSIGFFRAVVIAVALTAVSTLVDSLLDVEGDAYQLRAVRRRVRGAQARNVTDVPGVIFFEIDGLSEHVLRHALDTGHAPTMKRWLDEGSHRIVSWECDLSSQTGASQAALLLGSNEGMPAFRWYEKETGQMLVSNKPKDAAEIERRHSDGAGLLAVGGTSRGNLVSGDAPRCSATMSALRDKERTGSSEFFAYFADPYGFLRTLSLMIQDVWIERFAARRQRRSGAEHVHRGGVYPYARAAITVVMRDLNTASLMGDIVEGVPVSYSTYVGYDEVAHHSGILEPDAMRVLAKHDKQLERLERAMLDAPRPYHVVVLSDHGQTQGRPFRQRYDETLEDVVKRGLSAGDVAAPPSVPEAWGEIGALLTEVGQQQNVGGRIVKRATRERMDEGTVVLGPGRNAAEQEHAVEEQLAADTDEAPEVIVLASGCLGLVYLPRVRRRLTLEEIAYDHPGLVQTLAGHEGIGFVMVRSEKDGPVVLGRGGSHRLRDGHVDGVDPLAVFDPTTADHLRRHDGFAACPDILVNGRYYPEEDEIAPFEDFMGSHGGIGGFQTHPFAFVPAAWSAEPEPIVGGAQMHRVLKRWLAESGQEVNWHADEQPAAEQRTAPGVYRADNPVH